FLTDLGFRLSPREVEKRRVVSRITVGAQVVSCLPLGVRASTHGRPLSVLLPEFPMPRPRPPRRRKPHRHRPTRKAPPVSPALLPLLPRPVLRAQGHPAVPCPPA